jgi:hypothetical protein
MKEIHKEAELMEVRYKTNITELFRPLEVTYVLRRIILVDDAYRRKTRSGREPVDYCPAEEARQKKGETGVGTALSSSFAL